MLDQKKNKEKRLKERFKPELEEEAKGLWQFRKDIYKVDMNIPPSGKSTF